MRSVFLTQPYLLSLNPSSEMNVVWILREPLQSVVEYGSTEKLGNSIAAQCFEIQGLCLPASEEGYGNFPEDNTPVTVWQCIAKIEGLAPGEQVYYRCKVEDEYTPVYHFHTAPEPGDPYRFVQVSDLQCLPACDEAMHAIGSQNPDFILYSGDMVRSSWRADQWFDLQEPWQDADQVKRAFFPCMQQEDVRLMQYAPTFFCPGNHELNDMRYGEDKSFSVIDKNWNWSIFMQLFRPLYPDTDTTSTGRRWYSADYGDMHIVSLSINRWARWGAHDYPGWRLFDSIAPGSPQIQWLEQDLQEAKTKFKWVIQHFHILNRGKDVQDYLCQPQIGPDGEITYPDDHGGQLMDLFEKYGVNAVSFGHSHVYERYFTKGCHYIEAARITDVCYRGADTRPHISGILPLVEDNSKRSFLVLERKEGGIFATAFYGEGERQVFDQYQIADENGRSVGPQVDKV